MLRVMAKSVRPEDRNQFEIAIISALTVERDAIEALLDEDYEQDGFSYEKAPGDPNVYTIGRLGNQNVVLAYLPGMGTIRAAAMAASLLSSFRGIKVAFLVGICGATPKTLEKKDIFLGDVIVSHSIIQVDFGRQYPNGFVRKQGIEDTLAQASPEIRAFIGKVSGYKLRNVIMDKINATSTELCSRLGFAHSACPGAASDELYSAEHRHKHWVQSCHICDNCKGQDDPVCESALESSCKDIGCDTSPNAKRNRIQRTESHELIDDSLTGSWNSSQSEINSHPGLVPVVHFGRLACGNSVVKSGSHRDQIARQEKTIGFEMESAGICDYIPTIVIKGVCDYADSHKNKRWQRYASVTAAACTKAVLEAWRPSEITKSFVSAQQNPESTAHRYPVHWTITRSRNSLFTGRNAIIQDLETIIRSSLCNTSSTERCWIVIAGLGGQGKSEICLNLAQLLRPLFWGVFWIDVSTTSLAENGFLNLGSKLSIPTKTWEDVWQYLANIDHPWLLILDNADDPSIDYSQYFPDGPFGVVILTSRNPECLEYATSPGAGIVLEGLPISDAQKLLLLNASLHMKKSASLETDAYQVAQTLQSHPLALLQARAYIIKGYCSMKDYPQVYERQRQRLLTHRPTQARSRYQDVYATFEASAEIIQSLASQRSIDAMQLLSVLAFCGPNQFPTHMFKAVYNEARKILRSTHQLQSEAEADFDFVDDNDDIHGLSLWHLDRLPSFVQVRAAEWDSFRVVEAIDLLKTFSFITTDSHDDLISISLHPLVHAWAKDRLDQDVQHQMWIATGCLFACSDNDNDFWWKHLRQLQAHLQALLSWDIQKIFLDEPTQMVARILVRGGFRLSEMHRDQEISQLVTKILRYLRLELLEVDSQWPGLYSLIAENLGNLSKIKDAVFVTKRLIEIRRQTLPESHPSILKLLGQLAGIYEDDGQLEEAIPIFEQIVQAYEKAFPEENTDRLEAQQRLAAAYIDNGEADEALPILERVIRIQSQSSGEDNLSLLTSQHELARVYMDNGQTKESIALFEHVVEVGDRSFFGNHYEHLTTKYLLAEVYRNDGQKQKAISLMEEVVRIGEESLPESDVDLLVWQFALGFVYETFGQFQAAIPVVQHVALVRSRVLPENDEETLRAKMLLGRLYVLNGEVQKGLPLLQHVVRIRELTLPVDDYDRSWAVQSLSKAYLANGQAQEAATILKESVEAQESSTEDDATRLISMHQLAIAYWTNGQKEEAVKVLEEVVKIRQQSYEENNRERLVTEQLLASFRWTLGDRESGKTLMRQVANTLEELPDRYFSFRGRVEHWTQIMEADTSKSEKATT